MAASIWIPSSSAVECTYDVTSMRDTTPDVTVHVYKRALYIRYLDYKDIRKREESEREVKDVPEIVSPPMGYPITNTRSCSLGSSPNVRGSTPSQKAGSSTVSKAVSQSVPEIRHTSS